MTNPFMSPYSAPPYQAPWPVSPLYSPVPQAAYPPADNQGNATATRIDLRKLTPAERELQKRFPGDYARLIERKPVQETWQSLKQNVQTLQQLGQQKPVKDHQLITLGDFSKLGGSALIATLATLGLRPRIWGVGEFLGFASWFGAMAATPRIINLMVQAKTGIDLNQHYSSSYGQYQNLYKDPNYLPLHILPESAINRVGDRLKIPYGPNRKQQIEEKVRQISVQSHTWWMLMAGPATPVIAGWICDRLQEPIMRNINELRLLSSSWKTFSKKDTPELAAQAENYLSHLVGNWDEHKVARPSSTLASWWKDFNRHIAEKSGLLKNFSVEDVVDSDHQSLRAKLVDYLATSGKMSEKNEVHHTLDWLNRQFRTSIETDGSVRSVGRLEDIRQQGSKFLQEAYSSLFETTQEFVDATPKQIQLRHPKLQQQWLDFAEAFRHDRLQNPFDTLKSLLKDSKDYWRSDDYAQKANALLPELDKRGLEDYLKQSQHLQSRITNAQSTVTHLRDLFQNVKSTYALKWQGTPAEIADTQQQAKAQVSKWLSQPKYGIVNSLLEQGREMEARNLVGQENPALFNQLLKARRQHQDVLASRLMGASPEEVLTRVLKEINLGNLWRRRMVKYLGGGMIAASALYSIFFVGRDFGPKTKTSGGTL